MSIARCINLDWLEVYVLESSINYPHDADYFRRCGYFVQEREYGTRVYNEMFTVFGNDGLPMLEVRRNPKSVAGFSSAGVMDRYASHIRLVNRTCYVEDAAGLLQDFLNYHGYGFGRISRLDICLDFEKFDSGDDPQKFLQRYISGKYSKINQANIHVHGIDEWDGRQWNSVSWGNPKSMVSTKIYNKTLELKMVHDKPYIRQAWRAAGLIDDWHKCTRFTDTGEEYEPAIWRLEFSIKSSTKNWFVVEDSYSSKKKLRSIKHTLDMYHTRVQMLDVFASLASHYFCFKHFEKGKRKDRCKDKELFRFADPGTFYKLTNVATSNVTDVATRRLISRLLHLKCTSIDFNLHKAIDVIVTKLEERLHKGDYNKPLNDSEVEILRRVIAWRVQHSENALTDDIDFYKSLLSLEDQLF